MHFIDVIRLMNEDEVTEIFAVFVEIGLSEGERCCTQEDRERFLRNFKNKFKEKIFGEVSHETD